MRLTIVLLLTLTATAAFSKEFPFYFGADVQYCKMCFKQNYGDIYACKWGGFSGFLSRLRYYAYALPFYSIEKIYNQGPSQAPCASTGAKPPNLSPEYWMTTGFPNTQVNV